MPNIVAYLIYLGKELKQELPVDLSNDRITGLAAFAEASRLAVLHPDKKVTVEFVTTKEARK